MWEIWGLSAATAVLVCYVFVQESRIVKLESEVKEIHQRGLDDHDQAQQLARIGDNCQLDNYHSAAGRMCIVLEEINSHLKSLT